jgi:hypothetical protein
VAGPCRILTGFPISPTDEAYKARRMLKSSNDYRVVVPLPGKRIFIIQDTVMWRETEEVIVHVKTR